MKQILLFTIISLSSLLIISCVSQNRLQTSTDFQAFDKAFAQLDEWDNVSSRNTNWALGRLHEVETPILKNELFYTVFDTSAMTYRYWEDRIYAEAKINLPRKHTGYFVTRQTEDITYDRTTVLIIVDKNYNYVQDFIFSEFIGYEGYITETQSKMIRQNKNDIIIQTNQNESYFNYEAEEQVEKTIILTRIWMKNQFVEVDKK